MSYESSEIRLAFAKLSLVTRDAQRLFVRQHAEGTGDGTTEYTAPWSTELGNLYFTTLDALDAIRHARASCLVSEAKAHEQLRRLEVEHGQPEGDS